MKELTPAQKSNIAQYFNQHKGVDAFHFTEDGQCFRNEHDALNHGRSLKFNNICGEEVVQYTRADVETWAEYPQKKAAKAEEPKAPANAVTPQEPKAPAKKAAAKKK